ncbi:hypothetical protein BDW22DRAFT_1445316 [Trametopsis cervina]|nr:hypothetical protein BDW22DRAFT_1445316 [Trametopsis cervina]
MDTLPPLAVASIACASSQNDLLALNTTSRAMNNAFRARVFAKLRLHCDSSSLIEFATWVVANQGFGRLIVDLTLSGRNRRGPHMSTSVKPSLAWVEVAGLVYGLPRLHKLSLSWFCIYEALSSLSSANNVTELHLEHIELRVNGIPRSPITPLFSPRILSVHHLQFSCNHNGFSLAALGQVKSFTSADISPRHAEWMVSVLTECGASLHTLRLQLALRQRVFPHEWQAVPFKECRVVNDVTICMPLCFWQSVNDAADRTVWLTSIIEQLPPTLQRLTIEVDFREWYGVRSYTAIMAELRWNRILNSIAGLPVLKCLAWVLVHKPTESFSNQDFTSVASMEKGNGLRFHYVAATCKMVLLLPIQAFTTMVSTLNLCGILCKHLADDTALLKLLALTCLDFANMVAPYLHWSDVIYLFSRTPRLRTLAFNDCLISSLSTFRLLDIMPISLELSNVTFVNISAPVSQILRALPFERIAFINCNIPPALVWDSVPLRTTAATITWGRPLNIDDVHSMPIFASISSLATWNMTDVGWAWLEKVIRLNESYIQSLTMGIAHNIPELVVQIPLDFWFGEDDYRNRQRGLCKLIDNLPLSVTHLELQLSYYAWEKFENTPYTEFDMGMNWNHLDSALGHLSHLQQLGVYYYGQKHIMDTFLDERRGGRDWVHEQIEQVRLGLPRVVARADVQCGWRIATENLNLC